MKLKLDPKLHAAVSHFVAEIAKLIDACELEKPQASGFYPDAERAVVDDNFIIMSDKLHKGNALFLGQSDYPINALYSMYNTFRVLEHMCSVYSGSTIATLIPRLFKMRPQIELMVREFTYLAHSRFSAHPFQSMWVVDDKTRKLAQLYEKMFDEIKTIDDPNRIINPTALKLILKAVEFEDELDFSGDKSILEIFGYEPLTHSMRFYDCIQQYRAIAALSSDEDLACDSITFIREGEYDRWLRMHNLEDRINSIYGLSGAADVASSRALLVREQAAHLLDEVKSFNNLTQDDPTRHERAVALYQQVMHFEKELKALEKTVNVEHTRQQTIPNSDDLQRLQENVEDTYQFGAYPILNSLGHPLPDRISAKHYLQSKCDLLSGSLLDQIHQDLNEHTAYLKHYAQQHNIKVIVEGDEISSQTLEESVESQAQLIARKEQIEQKIQTNIKAIAEQNLQLTKFSKPDFATIRKFKKSVRQDTIRICENNIAELALQQDKLADKLIDLNKQIGQYTRHIQVKNDEQIQAQRLAKRTHIADGLKSRLSTYKEQRHKHYFVFDLLQKIFSFGKTTQQQLREAYVDTLIQCLDQYVPSGDRKQLSEQLQTGLTMFKPRRKHENSLANIINDVNKLTP